MHKNSLNYKYLVSIKLQLSKSSFILNQILFLMNCIFLVIIVFKQTMKENIMPLISLMQKINLTIDRFYETVTIENI